MKDFNANNYPEIYKEIGVNLDNLGCIMIDLEPIKNFEISEDLLYKSENKDKYRINGMVCDTSAHITLLYGLMKPAQEYKKHIDNLLEGIDLTEFTISKIGKFDSHDKDEEYYCVVAHIEKSEELLEANAKMSLLPHINTYPEYNPHMTVAYIKKDDKILKYILDGLQSLVGTKVKMKSLNYGK